ncbi:MULTISPECIES: TniQ family protein [Streptomyces]|uniref:TniQ family protein n=1 Tax=Streptomyces TaxID=1883 RepID=UPI00324D3ED5
MAAGYEVSRMHMAEACGLLRHPDGPSRIAASGPTSAVYGLGDADAVRVERATGLSACEVQAMTWSRFVGTAVRSELIEASPRERFRVMKASWIDPRELRFCPSCIDEKDGRWPLEWCTPWAFACLRHGCYLLAECPTCRTPIRAGVRLGQGVCRGFEKHHLTDAVTWRCGMEYRKMQAPDLQDKLLAYLQRLLDSHLSSTRQEFVHARGDFADLAAMAEFALFLAAPEHLDGADPVVVQSFAEFRRRSALTHGGPMLEEAEPMVRTAGLRIASQIVFSDNPWATARAIADFASRPLASRARPLHEAWLKRPPQDTTERLEGIVRSVRIAAPSTRGPDGRILERALYE